MGSPSIPLLDLSAQNGGLRPELDRVIADVLDGNRFCLGSDVAAFEDAFAAMCGVRYAVGVNTGTSALHVALQVLDIGPGDEVITTPMTFIATTWAILYVGATPVYVDIDEATMNIGADAVRKAITPNTRAIMPVHLHGTPCEMDALVALSEETGIPLIEDAAQAHGATYNDRPIGSFGRLAGFSFYPGKNLGACGEGGALVTDDEALYRRAASMRNHSSPDKFHHDEVGFNYRMAGIQGAVLGVKLPRLAGWNERRRELAAVYDELLSDTPLALPSVPSAARSVYHHYAVRCAERESLCAYLSENGIGWGLHYPVPLHVQPCCSFLGYKKGDFPVAEANGDETLCLPMYPELADAAVERVSAVIHEFYAKG